MRTQEEDTHFYEGERTWEREREEVVFGDPSGWNVRFKAGV
jgi:hypothetical protein